MVTNVCQLVQTARGRLFAAIIILVIIGSFKKFCTTVELTKETTTTRTGYDHTITVVTAFYDIGSFRKTSAEYRTPEKYFKWSRAFKYLNGTLVVYSDCDAFIYFMRSLRKGKEHITRIIKFPREKLWPFELRQKIKNIFSNPEYPKHQPNTIIPDYSLIQHSKFAIIYDAIIQHYFDAKHYCWLDVGVFRDILDSQKTFHVELPPLFYDSKVSYNRLYQTDPSTHTASSIFLGNNVWVTGNAFVGTSETLRTFCTQYKTTCEYYISKGLANTDQQVLMAMYTEESKSKLNIQISIQQNVPGTFKGVYCPNDWFYLAYLMMNYN